ncbi:MAG: hypothetical protein ACI9WU_004101 [Myxococcota bacterium]|jgi:hypothetical protein
MRINPIRWVVFSVALCSAGAASAETLQLEPSQDNTIYQGTAESNGAGIYMFTGQTGPGVVLRTLLQFDLSAVPADVTIDSVTLSLSVTTPKAGTSVDVSAHRLTTLWGEGASNAPSGEAKGAPAMAGDATWDNAVHPSTPWIAAGGDFAAASSATAAVQGPGTTISWTGAGLVADVQAWTDGAAPNHGWIMLGGEAALAKRYASRNNTNTGLRPQLTIEYSSNATIISDTTPGIDVGAAPFIAGNLGTGFGGAVGGGQLHIDTSDQGAIALSFVRGAGAFDDSLVLYFDSAPGGFSSTTAMFDAADDGRAAVTGTAGGDKADITFAPGFEADFAISWNAEFGASVYALAEGAAGSLVFIGSWGGTGTNGETDYTVSGTLAELGISTGATFGVVGTYINGSTAFRADEAFGIADLDSGNPGATALVLAANDLVTVHSFVPVCGDGAVSDGELCDDSNAEAGDGCSADCTAVEAGFVCATGGESCACLEGFAGPTCADVDECAGCTGLILVGVVDGPLTGGLPKAVELYACEDIADLSGWSLQLASNGNPLGNAFDFPADPAQAGQFIRVSKEAVQFEEFFGGPPNYISGIASSNGNDAFGLSKDGVLVDVFGEIGVDGDGEVWDHEDGWAYRQDFASANATWDPGAWSFSGTNALDGETVNDTETLVPAGTWTEVGCSADAQCSNTAGDYDCACNDGFSGDGDVCTECAAGTFGADCAQACDPIDCDDADPCTTDTCDPAAGCLNVVMDCDDADACTADTCELGVCGNAVIECDDGDACTGVESCDVADGCQAGAAPICDDANACNGVESCAPATGCVAGTPLTCDDQDACNGVESCDAAAGCVAGVALTCDDQNVCTGQETCDATSGCVAGTSLTCDDSDACTGAETCDPAAGCQSNTPLACDDSNACNGAETCDPASGCLAGAALVCGDNDACNGEETCDPAAGCQPATSLVCDDGDACTGVESCDPDSGCVAGTELACDDGNDCNGVDACDPGTGCTIGAPLDCDDANPCTDDDCDPTAGCLNSDNTAVCDDGSVCTDSDVCASGSCAGTPIDSDDGNPCTDDTCDPILGAQHTANTADCDDGDFCTADEVCADSACTGTAVDCDDGDPCTTDTCDAASGCVYQDAEGCCSADADCSITGSCLEAVCGDDNTCGFEPIPECCADDAECDDDDEDTLDWCDGSTQLCINEPPCSSDADCDDSQECVDGQCVTPMPESPDDDLGSTTGEDPDAGTTGEDPDAGTTGEDPDAGTSGGDEDAGTTGDSPDAGGSGAPDASTGADTNDGSDLGQSPPPVPEPGNDEGGCSAGSRSTGAAPAVLLFGALLLLAVRRKVIDI